VAAWKGLALGRRLPLLGVPTLDALTRVLPPHDGVVCALLDARMHEVFGAAYRFRGGARTKLIPDRVAPVEAVLAELPDGPVLFLGDGASLYENVIRERVPGAVFAPPHLSVPRASAVAAEAFDLLAAGATADAAAVSPVYLRKSQPEEATKKVALP
jgi:tRNA threonylcarbamoyladenosine biosynthesis protein TsaB